MADETSKQDNLHKIEIELRDLQNYLYSIRNGDVTLQDSVEALKRVESTLKARISAVGEDIACKQNVDDFWTYFSPLINSLTHSNANLAENLSKLKTIDDLIKKVLYALAQVTIPYRINEMLQGSVAGYNVSFNENPTILDLLPDDKDRADILTYMHDEPDLIKGGIINPQSGLIYRYDDSARARLGKLIALIIFVVGTIVIVAGTTFLNAYSDAWRFSPKDIPNLLIGWLVLLFGILVHVIVDAYKTDRLSYDFFGKMDLMISAHFNQIVLKIAIALLIFAVVNTLTPNPKDLTPFYYVLVGYSLDSFVGIFQTRAAKVADDLAK